MENCHGRANTHTHSNVLTVLWFFTTMNTRITIQIAFKEKRFSIFLKQFATFWHRNKYNFNCGIYLMKLSLRKDKIKNNKKDFVFFSGEMVF